MLGIAIGVAIGVGLLILGVIGWGAYKCAKAACTPDPFKF